jgi:hypothetical protein
LIFSIPTILLLPASFSHIGRRGRNIPFTFVCLLYSSKSLQLMMRNPRHEPLSQEAIATRHHQAQSSAVEWPDLGGPSTFADRWTRASNPIRTVTTQEQSSPLKEDTRILVIDIPRQGQRSGFDSRTESTTTTIHVNADTIPHMACQDDLKRPKKRIRRCRSSRRNAKGQGQIGVKDKSRQVAGYYYPPDHLGGKSMSTLWDYGLGMST